MILPDDSLLKEENRMKLVRRALLILHFFIGIGAMFGGSMAILFPEGPGGMPTDTLKNSPFSDFLIPGIILFTVIGLGNILGGILHLKKSKLQVYASGIAGGALMIWIVVQCIMLEAIVFLHVLFFILGTIQGLLALIMLFHQALFPADIIIKIYNKIRKTK
jgi:hypothetical protein